MAGSIVVTSSEIAGTQMVRYAVAWTSDAAGNVSANSFDMRRGRIKRVEFIPGTGGAQPTAAYKATVTEPDGGADILAGLGNGSSGLSNAAAQTGCPMLVNSFEAAGIASAEMWLDSGAYTPVVSAAGATKSGTIIIWVAGATW